MAIFRGIHWDMLLVQDIDMVGNLMMASQTVRFLEESRCVILVSASIERFL